MLLPRVLVLALAIGHAIAQTCYSDIKFPRVIAPEADDQETWMQSMAASETLNALFVGGETKAGKLLGDSNSETAIIMRLDLEQNTWVWSKAFRCGACQMTTITALAVNPDGTKLAASGVMRNGVDFKYDERSYIFVVKTADGHYLTEVHEI